MPGMRLVAVLAVVVLAVTGCNATSGDSKHVTATVGTWAPEGSNHVAVQVTFTNDGTSAATALCSFDALDDGGSVVGDDTDGPADDIPPGQSAHIRLLIKTSVESDLVATVEQNVAVGCS